MPNPLSFLTSCVYLEPRLLPSTGITRLHQYYEPFRHPKTPRPSLTSFWLIIPDHAKGLPVLRTLSLCTCCRQYPGAAVEVLPCSLLSNRIRLPRKGWRVVLHIVLFEDCSAFTHVTACTLALPPYFVTRISRRLQTFRYLHACSGCIRLEHFAGWGLHPLESAAFARRTPIVDITTSRKQSFYDKLNWRVCGERSDRTMRPCLRAGYVSCYHFP